jgi:hypothetical protein
MIKRVIAGVLRRLGYRIARIPPTESEIADAVLTRGRDIVSRISPDYTVLNGVFKGMKYPTLDITEGALVPKFVGSYEAQLHPLITRITRMPYTDVIDVGCAEGYYAVGLARSMPETSVHGYDINERDLRFCRQMANVNHVGNLTLHSLCNTDTLLNFPFREKGLIFCDCEGYELQLFDDEVVSALHEKNVDVLVELHEVLIPGITSRLLQRFNATHDLQIVSTKDRIPCDWAGLESLTDDEKAFAVSEHRGGYHNNVYMEWAYFTNTRAERLPR